MGYKITIGDLTLDTETGAPTVAYTARADAPDHDPAVDVGNVRRPSYTAWEAFCRISGLEPLFFGCPAGGHRETGLMAEHPGIARLLPGDLEAVRDARVARQSAMGEIDPGFGPGEDQTLARLIWLEYWIEWAVSNCANPSLANE